MSPRPPFLSRAAICLTFASAVSILFSIAVSQILLALALAALLLSGEKLRLPRIWLPLVLFMAATLVSLAFSGNPAAGLPQVRKFYVFCELLVVFSCLRDMAIIRWLFLTWAGFAAITALRGFVQFWQKLEYAHEIGRDSYNYYVSERITGFMSHWNTFSAQEMFALLMLAAFLFFSPARRRIWVWLACAAVIMAAILLGETRGVWIATAGAGAYLLWFWRRWLVAAVPVAIVAAFFLSPPVIRERFTSLLEPSKVDSNQHRIVTWRTGMVMIERHPLLGLGPEGVKLHFNEYVPPDIPRPLPVGWYGHLHDIYLQYAAERGIPAMLLMMWLLLQILWDFWRGLRLLPPGPSDRRFLLHGGIAVVLATLAEGVVEYNLGDSEVLTMFLIVVACGYLALEKEERLKPGVPEPERDTAA
jgi:putative inorganic carbon (HCO3(-)) transporter